MIDTLIEEMETYAVENNIPIMQKEGVVFLQECIQKYHVKKILEIGSAIGYSAIQMARSNKDIHIVTIERDESRYLQAIKNIDKAHMKKQITIHHGDALETMIEGQFDLIFIDAAKAQYIKFFERYANNLADNGIIISDNLKFHGMVEHPEIAKNRNTRALVKKIGKYVEYLKNNQTYESIFYDFGDGVAISKRRKKADRKS